jgi:hypothetical protein
VSTDFNVTIQTLMRRWKRLGFGFAIDSCDAAVDPERLIADTAFEGRREPVCMWAMLTWLVRFGDLVNVPRLERMITEQNGPALGVIIDIAVENGADRKLKNAGRRCRPFTVPQILFSVMEEKKTTRTYEQTYTLPQFAKWGLFCSSFNVKSDALHAREHVLRNNRNLLLRTLFGANARSEILFALSETPKMYISKIAQTIGLSYQPVYAEIRAMMLNRLVVSELIGRINLISLNPAMKKMITAFSI